MNTITYYFDSTNYSELVGRVEALESWLTFIGWAFVAVVAATALVVIGMSLYESGVQAGSLQAKKKKKLRA